MKVKYLNLQEEFKDGNFLKVIRNVLKECRFILGPAVKEFEEKFAKLCGTRYAVGVNSGTDAIFLGLKALGIGRGDEVITAPNSFIATAGAVVATGAKPVFVDVDEEYNMDVTLIEKVITRKTKAILPVHLTGSPADMPEINRIAKKHNLYVLEDAAQAAGAKIGNRPVGSFGIFGCFSLHPLKNLNVIGDGGVVTTNSKTMYEKLNLLRNHGLKNRDEIKFFAYNSRLDTIHAIVALEVIKKLEWVTGKRIENARKYDRGLSMLKDFVTIPLRRKNVKQVFHTYVIQVKDRDRLIGYLADHNIETKIHYPIPIHLQEGCRHLGYRKGDFPVCEKQCKSIISLPIHQFLTDREINYVISSIKSFYQKVKQ